MKILNWIANSPIASFLKIFAAGILGWIVVNVEEVGLHPALAIGLASSIPVLINWLNPADSRYGSANEGVSE
jgi:hypothetical protein